jgi:hypothetical protein
MMEKSLEPCDPGSRQFVRKRKNRSDEAKCQRSAKAGIQAVMVAARKTAGGSPKGATSGGEQVNYAL